MVYYSTFCSKYETFSSKSTTYEELKNDLFGVVAYFEALEKAGAKLVDTDGSWLNFELETDDPKIAEDLGFHEPDEEYEDERD